MDLGRTVWVGSYCAEQNAYDIDCVESLCDANAGFYRNGFSGFAPVCFGGSHDDVREKLDAIRDKKERVFREFEDAVLGFVTDLAEEGAVVRIEYAEPQQVGDDYVRDGITLIPENMKEHPSFPVVALNYYFREFFANTMNAETMQDALKCVAEDIYNTLMELWEDPQECPYCE